MYAVCTSMYVFLLGSPLPATSSTTKRSLHCCCTHGMYGRCICIHAQGEYITSMTGMHEFAEFAATDVGTGDSGLNSIVLASNNEMVSACVRERKARHQQDTPLLLVLFCRGRVGVLLSLLLLLVGVFVFFNGGVFVMGTVGSGPNTMLIASLNNMASQ